MGKYILAAYSIVLFGVVLLSSASADQPFYRCTVNGKTIYTDKPCDAPMLPGVEGPSGSTSDNPTGQARKPSIELDYSTPYGIWRGQAQYQASSKGQPLREAHAVIPLVMQLEKQGRVRKSREWLQVAWCCSAISRTEHFDAGCDLVGM
jgi:hypothetical protein